MLGLIGGTIKKKKKKNNKMVSYVIPLVPREADNGTKYLRRSLHFILSLNFIKIIET